jgi:hypothetical protein
MVRGPSCHPSTLRIIAAITARPLMRRILYPLKLAVDPPLLAPAGWEPVWFTWASLSSTSLTRGEDARPGCVRRGADGDIIGESIPDDVWRQSHLTTPGGAAKMGLEFLIRGVLRYFSRKANAFAYPSTACSCR